MTNNKEVVLKCPRESMVFWYILLYSILAPLSVGIGLAMISMIPPIFDLSISSAFFVFPFFPITGFLWFKILENGLKTVYVTEDGLVFRIFLFYKVKYDWPEINEFGEIYVTVSTMATPVVVRERYSLYYHYCPNVH